MKINWGFGRKASYATELVSLLRGRVRKGARDMSRVLRTVSFISVSCSTEHHRFLSMIVRVECRRVRSFLYKELMCLF